MREVLSPEALADVMARLRARRQRVNRPCEVCGVEMRQVPRKRRYCGATCRQRAWYGRTHPRAAAAEEA